ncbi:MAG: porin [Gammaproteobacteria bacterium]|nr:porin [Gammaproteobacteria bacterium]
MQKKLITLAVAGILAAPMMAQAAVETYGQARVSVGYISDDNPTTTAEDSKMAVSSHASRLGFRGNDDLGGGLKAVWQIERGVDFTDNSATLSVRNTFVGLAGGFGTVIAGTHDTPYKIATAKLDPFADTYADYNAVIDATMDARAPNVIAYISPDWSGFTLAAAYVADAGVTGNGADNLPDGTKDNTNSAVSLAGMYTNGPLYVSLAYQTIDNAAGLAANGEALNGTKLGVGYSIAGFDLGLVYENKSQDADAVNATAKIDQSNVYISAAYGVTANTKVKLAVGQKDETDSGNNNGGTFFALGASTNMSANTEAYVLYTQMGNDNGATAANGLVGVSSGFSDKTTSALAVGLNVKFSSM